MLSHMFLSYFVIIFHSVSYFVIFCHIFDIFSEICLTGWSSFLHHFMYCHVKSYVFVIFRNIFPFCYILSYFILYFLYLEHMYLLKIYILRHAKSYYHIFCQISSCYSDFILYYHILAYFGIFCIFCIF